MGFVHYMTIIVIAIFVIYMICEILKSPFEYPYYVHQFDVSGKRKPAIENYIDQFIIDGNFSEFIEHIKRIEEWKMISEEQAKKSILKGYRQEQYEQSIDDSHAFVFELVRKQTRYMQRNYIKFPYEVKYVAEKVSCDFEYLKEREMKLREIGYACTLKEYHSTNQRKLMTKELKESIKKRDNYTCQICGKYMPDGVGLQIDHIIPVSKGGKTVPSNLQVLCSKCNGSKSNKC